MRFFGLLLIVFFMPLSAWAELAIPEAFCVHEDVIRVQDAVRALDARGEAFLQDHGKKTLLAAPRTAGSRVVLSGAGLAALLRKQVGANFSATGVPEQVTVQRGGQVVFSQALYPQIERVLLQALKGFEGEIRLREYRLPEAFFLQESSGVRLQIVPQGRVQPGRIGLQIQVLSETGDALRVFSGTVYAEVWKEVPCAAVALRKGDILQADMVVMKNMDLAKISRKPWNGQDLPLRLRTYIRAGEVISLHAVESVPVVQRGQVVTLLYKGRTLSLSVPAECLEDGGVGNIIPVRNMQSQKTVRAEVLGSGTVRVP